MPLYRAASAPQTEPSPKSASDDIQQTLLQRITLDGGIRAGTLLKDAMKFLAERYNLNIRVDDTAFQRMGKPSPAGVKVEARPHLIDVYLASVLQILLEQVDADLEIRNGVIWILPLAKPRPLAARLPASAKSFRKQLDRRLTLENGIDANTMLGDAVQYLADKMQVTLYLDSKAFQKLGVQNVEEQPVKFGKQQGARFAEVLKAIADQVNGTFILRGNLILIVPNPGIRAETSGLPIGPIRNPSTFAHPTDGNTGRPAQAAGQCGGVMLDMADVDDLVFQRGHLVPGEAALRRGQVERIHAAFDHAIALLPVL
jgi:hypothetical protein